MINVLAIDDEAPIRQWLNYHISRFGGFRCTVAANAEGALRCFEADPPDIILTDIEMPGMDGLEMLRRMRRKDDGVYVIILTSHSDFSYARTALTLGTSAYMLKTEMTEESLLAALQKANAALQSRLSDTAAKSFSAERSLRALAARQAAGPLPLEDLAARGIVLEDLPTVAVDLCRADPLRAEQLFRAAPALKHLYSFSRGADHLLLVCNLEEPACTGWAELHRLCRVLLAEFPASAIGISDRLEHPCELPGALALAQYRCLLPFYEPAQRLFDTGTPSDFSIEEETFQIEYLKALLNQDFALAYHLVRDALDILAEKRPADLAAVKKLLCTAVNSFLHFARDVSEAADDISTATKEAINAAPSLPAIVKIVEGVFAPITALTDSAVEITAPVRQAIEYMERHYAEKITLAETAERAAFSPEHFSRVFSRETGINYIAYLNNLRMKHAVSLLEATNLKVYEIAERVGFSSLSYFSTTFKKKFGQNPYEYQVNYQRSKTGAPL